MSPKPVKKRNQRFIEKLHRSIEKARMLTEKE